jgi:hypothetical protein
MCRAMAEQMHQQKSGRTLPRTWKGGRIQKLHTLIAASPVHVYAPHQGTLIGSIIKTSVEMMLVVCDAKLSFTQARLSLLHAD